jgi:hypothetical protein
MKTHIGLRLSLLGMLVVMASHAGAEQCILNDGGFTAVVKWFEAKDVKVTKDGNKRTITATNKYVQRDLVPNSQKSCISGSGDLAAAVSVKDGKAANIATKFGASALIAAGAVAFCVGTEGAGCGEAISLVPEGITAVSAFLPDAANVFYFDVPQQNRHKHRNVIVGTVFSGNTISNPHISWKEVKYPDRYQEAK